jgi:YcxB-like protein
MTADDGLVAEFAVTEQDYISFCRFHATQSRFCRRCVLWRRLCFFLLPPLAGIIIVGLDRRSGLFGAPSFIVAMVILGAVMAGIDPTITRAIVGWRMRRRLRDGTFASWLQPTRIELSPDGLTWSSSSGNSLTRWSTFVDIATDGSAAYAYINSMQAYIIPRRAFADAASFERFVAKLRQYREHAPAI